VDDAGAWRTVGEPRPGLVPVRLEDLDRALAIAVPSGEVGEGELFGLEFECMSRVK
jgi:hypothetical protein